MSVTIYNIYYQRIFLLLNFVDKMSTKVFALDFDRFMVKLFGKSIDNGLFLKFVDN